MFIEAGLWGINFKMLKVESRLFSGCFHGLTLRQQWAPQDNIYAIVFNINTVRFTVRFNKSECHHNEAGVRKRIIPHSSNQEVDLNVSVLAGKATWCCGCTRGGPCAPFMEDASDSLAMCTLKTCCRSVCSLSHHSEPICILQLSWSHSCCPVRCNARAPAVSTMLFRPSKPSREWVHMLPSEELGVQPN